MVKIPLTGRVVGTTTAHTVLLVVLVGTDVDLTR
jgi:hypothetical protein